MRAEYGRRTRMDNFPTYETQPRKLETKPRHAKMEVPMRSRQYVGSHKDILREPRHGPLGRPLTRDGLALGQLEGMYGPRAMELLT